ncbi:lysozyme inhibitor LprI family protein [Vibrio cholerae]|uniref:hypothetical protein n=1 Tax=Vibrio cholerae TaxID=666 RepID=UPI0021CC046F|nr:hypothetical protein [Vibrio cholerae]
MKKWLLIMLASFSSVVSAKNESLDCKNAMNTFEINQCASMALDSAQAELTKYLEASFEHNVNDPDLVSARLCCVIVNPRIIGAKIQNKTLL